jgi:hypothetical protein
MVPNLSAKCLFCNLWTSGTLPPVFTISIWLYQPHLLARANCNVLKLFRRTALHNESSSSHVSFSYPTLIIKKFRLLAIILIFCTTVQMTWGKEGTFDEKGKMGTLNLLLCCSQELSSGIIICFWNLLYLHVSFVYITANIWWEYCKISLLFFYIWILDLLFKYRIRFSTKILLNPSLSKIVEEKWVSVLSVVCGRNEWRQASWKVRVISVELKCFASRQPVKCDANSGKQVAIVGC